VSNGGRHCYQHTPNFMLFDVLDTWTLADTFWTRQRQFNISMTSLQFFAILELSCKILVL